jgi:anti-sigma factor RsiW
MIERDEERLIQDVLDGQATPADAARLEAWLGTSEEGRTRKRELEELFAVLDRVPFAELPEGLASEVEEAVRARAASGKRTGVHERRLGMPRMRLALVFAMGIVAGVIGWGAVTGILNPSGPGRERVVGTMMPTPVPGEGAVRRSWSAGDTRIAAVAWRAGTSRWVRIEVEGNTPANVELGFDSAQLSPVAVRQSDPAARVVLDAGRIMIRVAAHGEFTFEFGERATGGPIQVIARGATGSIEEQLPSP